MHRAHPRLTQPNADLPDHVREVMLAASRWGGVTAFVTPCEAGARIASIPLIGCHAECEAWLRESLREDHGFEAGAAERVARTLFVALQSDATLVPASDDVPV